GAARPEWQTEYDHLGRVRQTEDPLHNFTNYDYSGFVSQVLITLPDPDGSGTQNPLPRPTIKQRFDVAGNLVEAIDESGAPTTYHYDQLNRLDRVMQPNPATGSASGGPLWQTSYNKLGQVTDSTDPEGRITSY